MFEVLHIDKLKNYINMLIPSHRCMHVDNMKRSFSYKTQDSLYILLNAQSLDEYITSVSILADRAKPSMKVFSIGTPKIHEDLINLGYVRDKKCIPLTYSSVDEDMKKYLNNQFKDFCWIPITKNDSTGYFEENENAYTSGIANPWRTVVVNQFPGQTILRTFPFELGGQQCLIHTYYHCKKWNSLKDQNLQEKETSLITRL